MKNKLKNYLKWGVLLLGISLLLVNCERDEIPQEATNLEESVIKKISITIIGKQEIAKNDKLVNTLRRFKEKKIENTYARTVTDSITGIEIETDYAKYIELANGYHSYTFPVTNTPENGGLQNILLSLQEDGSYEEYLVHYDITDNEIEILNNGEEVDFVNNITTTLIDSNFSSTAFERVIYEDDCIRIEFIPNTCSSPLQHEFGEPCDYDNPSNVGPGDYPPSPGGEYAITDLNCSGGSGGGEIPDIPIDPGPTTDPTDPGPTPNGGNPGTGGPSNPITSPASCTRNCIEGDEETNPCEELNKLLETPTYPITSPDKSTKDAIEWLQNHELDENNEEGFEFKHNVALEASAKRVPPGRVGDNFVKYHPYVNIYGGVHTHQDDHEKIPMFSPEDIHDLLLFSSNYSAPNTDASLFVHVLVSTHGIYAIKINDLAKLQTLQAIFDDAGDANEDGTDEHKDFTDNLEGKLLKYHERNSGEPNGSRPEYQRAFLNFITQDYDLGVSLYRKISGEDNWEEIIIDPNSSTEVLKIPCN